MNKSKTPFTISGTQKYLSRHRVKELLDFLMAFVIYHQPEEPLIFLVELLDECMMARTKLREPPTLFDSGHIQQIFKSFDTTKSGKITKQQFKTGLASMGIVNPQESFFQNAKLTIEEFELEARRYLTNYFDAIVNSK